MSLKDQFNAAAQKNAEPSLAKPRPHTLDDDIRHAADLHDAQRIKEIYEARPGLDPNRAIRVQDKPVLTWAVEHRKLDLARYMLSIGANADGVATGESAALLLITPLMVACGLGQDAPAFVELLLKHRANVSLRSETGCTALHFAMTLRGTPTEVIRQLVEAQCDPFLADCEGRTAFHAGVRWGNVESMKMLLSLADGVNAPNALTGKTPLQELQTAGGWNLPGNAYERKAEMLQLLSGYALQKVLAAAQDRTRRPLPALRKIGGKP